MKFDVTHEPKTSMCYCDALLTATITMEEVLSVLPFGISFDLVQLKGSTLKKAFEHSVRRYGSNSGEFLQVSGQSGPCQGSKGEVS